MRENFNDLTKKQKDIYDYIVSTLPKDYNDNVWITTSYRKIGKEVSISIPTVCSAFKVLEENGYIKTRQTSKGTQYKVLKVIHSVAVASSSSSSSDDEVYQSNKKDKIRQEKQDLIWELIPHNLQISNELSKKPKILYAYLKARQNPSNTDKDGWSTVTYKIIKQDLGFCKKTIFYSLNILEQNGYILIERTKISGKKPTKYKILDKLDKFNDKPNPLKDNELTPDNTNEKTDLFLQYLKENNDMIKEIKEENGKLNQMINSLNERFGKLYQ